MWTISGQSFLELKNVCHLDSPRALYEALPLGFSLVVWLTTVKYMYCMVDWLMFFKGYDSSETVSSCSVLVTQHKDPRNLGKERCHP